MTPIPTDIATIQTIWAAFVFAWAVALLIIFGWRR